MELCGEPDIFIGKRTYKFRRYSGLLEEPVIPEDHKKVRHTSRRRVTIDSFVSKNIRFNNNLTSCDETSLKIESNEIPSSSGYENDSLAAGQKKIWKTPIAKNKKNTRNKRRTQRDSFGLNCTFIDNEEGKQSAKEHQILPHSRRYSLRSSLGVTDRGVEKNDDFVTVRKINQLKVPPTKHMRSVEADKENTNSPPDNEKIYRVCQINEKVGDQGKYFSSNCTFIEDTEENQSSEFHQKQKSLHSDRCYSLRSSGGFDLSWKRNKDFVAVRKFTFPIKNETKIGENNEELQDNTDRKNHELYSTKSDLSTKEEEKNMNSSVQINKTLDKGRTGRRRTSCDSNYELLNNTQNNSSKLKDHRFYKKKCVSQRKPVDMNRTYIEDMDENEITKFQTNQQLFNSNKSYSLRSSLGVIEHNLKKNEDLAKVHEKNALVQIEPTENVVKRNHEILLVLQFDKTLEARLDELESNIELPVTGEDNSSIHIYQESDNRIHFSTSLGGQKYCHSNRFLKEMDKTLTQSCKFDEGTSSCFLDPFGDTINNEKGFVVDRETNEYNCTSLSKNAKKLNNMDKESLPLNNETMKFEENIEHEDCILPLNTKTRTSINEHNFSRADIKESKGRDKPEIIFEENLNESCLVENWITSHFHLDSKRQFFQICKSLNNSVQKPPDLNRAFIHFTSQEEENFLESIGIESIDQQSFQTLLENSNKGGDRKKNNESEKEKNCDKKKTIKKCSNLETIFENPEKKIMSSRRFKRSINFDNFSSFARVRRRKLKAKKINSFQSRDIVDTSKLDAILDKLSLSD